MGKRVLSLALALPLALGLTGCSRNKVAARTPDVDFYIQYASEKFDVPAEEISVVEFEKGTSAQRSTTIWPSPTEKYTIPPLVRLEWGGKVVSFAYSYFGDFYDTSYLHDDYYFDELYEGLREYYLDRLHVKDVIPMSETTIGIAHGAMYSNGIRYYLIRHELTGVDISVIEDFIHSEDVDHYGREDKMWLYVALEGIDPEAEIQQLIDDMMQLDHKIINTYVWSSLDGISVSRVPEEDRRNLLPIDHQLIRDKDYSTRWTIITPIKKEVDAYSAPYKVYQDYFYNTTNLPEPNKQEADASMDEANNMD